MFHYLTKTAGARTGAQYELHTDQPTTIGRGVDCHIVLTDPLASREHATLYFEDNVWWVRDENSRNGTKVNGQKADVVQMGKGGIIRVGSSEFRYEQSATKPSERPDLAQTLVRDLTISPDSQEVGLSALIRNPGNLTDLVDLHQLSLSLLPSSDPDEVIQLALEVLRQRTKSSVVGFLYVMDDGSLKPKFVIPEDHDSGIALSESLTEKVTKEKHAIWVNNQATDSAAASLRPFADAMCVPLLFEDHFLGALHLYLEHGQFTQSEFDFAISVGTMLAMALHRSQKTAVLSVNHQHLVSQSATSDELIGSSKPILDLKGRITRVARATGCVLIRGESGSGKELVARAVHRESTRVDLPMLSVNCAAIPRELMESQLFGHRKGSFTGADSDHVGWFEQADTGTLFLDEVGEMTLEGQAKLLRIMEGHPFLPVGGNKEVNVDVRIIAATNRDLSDFVRDGRFREDLYYRLSVFELYIPPLRDRGEDIETLVNYFLEHFKRQHGRPGLTLSEAARRKMLNYSWPGNVRQLRNVIDSAVVMAIDDELQPVDLGLRDVGERDLDTLRIDDWEKKLIREALDRTKNNVPDAAKMLGIGRATLYRKIEEYAIER